MNANQTVYCMAFILRTPHPCGCRALGYLMVVSRVINFETVITNCAAICWQPVNETLMKKSNPGGRKRMKWEKTTAPPANASRPMHPRPFNSFQQNANNPRRRRDELSPPRRGRRRELVPPRVIYGQLIFSLNVGACVHVGARVFGGLTEALAHL